MAKTAVVFRVDKRGGFKGTVTAIFFQEPERGGNMLCYGPIEKHGYCSPAWYYQDTRPATPAEYASLKRELETYGPPDAHYDLDVRTRIPRR